MPEPEALQQPAATDNNPLQPDAAALTKPEVCELLGKSERTVNTYMKSHRLPSRLIGGKAVFERGNVERLKADLETPIVRGVPILSGMAVSPAVSNDAGNRPAMDGQDPGNGALAVIDSGTMTTFARFADAIAAAVRPAVAPPPPPALQQWKTLKEAAEYSGLPPRWLAKQAKAGAPWAMNVGTEKTPDWRFRIAGGVK
jgi:predicted DNA-binding transcriptional regulator AlpA